MTVAVKPGAKAPGIVLGAGGAVVVRVRERAIDGKANEAVIEALARALALPKRAITLVRGARARRKLFSVERMTNAEVLARLARYVTP